MPERGVVIAMNIFKVKVVTIVLLQRDTEFDLQTMELLTILRPGFSVSLLASCRCR